MPRYRGFTNEYSNADAKTFDAPKVTPSVADTIKSTVITTSDNVKKIIVIGSPMAGTLGVIAGLFYANSKKSGFWGYVGYGLLGSILFNAGYFIASKVFIKKEIVPAIKTTTTIEKK